MPTREDIVDEARSWIGTPWHHQATVKQIGCDCLGLIRGVYINVGLLPPIKEWPSLGISEKYQVYDRKADNTTMLSAFDQYWIKIAPSEFIIGDVVIFNVRGRPQHAGIVADYRHGGFSFIHSMNNRARGSGFVSEHRLTNDLLKAVVAAYSIPGLN